MSTQPAVANVVLGEDGVLLLSGVLHFDSLIGLNEQLREPIASTGGDIILDLSGLERVNSVGLSLLLRVAEQAEQSERRLRLRGVPAGLQSMAEVCGLDVWLQQASAA